MDLVALETLNEKNNFVAIMNANIQHFDTYTHIGGIETTKGDSNTFTWVSTGKSINFKIDWTTQNPNNLNGIEFCLTVEKGGSAYAGFNDISCSTYAYAYICEARLGKWASISKNKLSIFTWNFPKYMDLNMLKIELDFVRFNG